MSRSINNRMSMSIPHDMRNPLLILVVYILTLVHVGHEIIWASCGLHIAYILTHTHLGREIILVIWGLHNIVYILTLIQPWNHLGNMWIIYCDFTYTHLGHEIIWVMCGLYIVYILLHSSRPIQSFSAPNMWSIRSYSLLGHEIFWVILLHANCIEFSPTKSQIVVKGKVSRYLKF
jgi:hypothetical protein